MKRVVFFLCFIFGIVCFFAARIIYVSVKASQHVFTPHNVTITLNPPKNAMQANILTVKGDVAKEGRNDTEFKPITTSGPLLQGESIRTGATGSAMITIPQIVDLSLGQQSQLDYLNGLPDALVVRQPKGTIAYATTQDSKPFSVRNLGLLVQLANSTNVTIDTDPDAKTVAVAVKSGLARLAYSDANNNTQVSSASAGQRALFDYSQQTLTLE